MTAATPWIERTAEAETLALWHLTAASVFPEKRAKHLARASDIIATCGLGRLSRKLDALSSPPTVQR